MTPHRSLSARTLDSSIVALYGARMPLPPLSIDPLTHLKRFAAVHGTQVKTAEALEISPQFLRDMLSGRRGISDRILEKLGLQRTTIYSER